MSTPTTSNPSENVTSNEASNEATATTTTASTVPGPQQPAPSNALGLPPIVLGCPSCEFLCTSNSQMCRHIYLTNHNIVSCSKCAAKLLCWVFAPGVQKLFLRGKREGVVIDPPTIETVERHYERTGHQNSHVPSREAFIKEGKAEDYGLEPTIRTTVCGVSGVNQFVCSKCNKYIPTWTQMTKHLDQTKHTFARCAICDIHLKCYGVSQPLRHEKLVGHYGLVGTFCLKADYEINNCGIPAVPQYKCSDCGISFIHPLHLGAHLTEKHNITLPDPTCQACGTTGKYSQLIVHRLNVSHENFDCPSLDVKPFMTDLPSQSASEDSLHQSQYRILYQCPDCLIIFASWKKLEAHLFSTKHSLAYCSTCSLFLKPKSNVSSVSDDHALSPGHKDILGEQRTTNSYEVLVDVCDEDLLSQLEQRQHVTTSATSSSHTTAEGDTLQHSFIVFQCPLKDCLCLYQTLSELSVHFQESKHGLINCTCCSKTWNIATTADWKEHQFDDQSFEVYQLGTESGNSNFSAVISRDNLLKYYSHAFVECIDCHHVIPKALELVHRGSKRCGMWKAQYVGLGMYQSIQLPTFSNTANTAAMGFQQPGPPQPQTLFHTAPVGQFVSPYNLFQVQQQPQPQVIFLQQPTMGQPGQPMAMMPQFVQLSPQPISYVPSQPPNIAVQGQQTVYTMQPPPQ